MENYKIKVNDETESKEAQELFFELGYYWNSGFGVRHLDVNFLYAKNKQITIGYCSEHFSSNPCYELTLPQLRDLVAQSKNEQGLISGTDAKLAWAKGENVQFRDEFDKWYQDWTDLKDKKNGFWITDFDLPNHQFRLKPCTIKLEIEIPAPFEPKVGEKCYRLAPILECGYTEFNFDNDHEDQFGCWKTESEIKQVVAAWRGRIKG
ncbi:hypothetical protein SDC64_07445 [Acinetobacter haemolyticus]|uniref:hypothetical protein n=1 Tax=Acinetobacter haemolyticus TaxID=29430 RepID=UPI002A6A9F48|nr:hypothetical protein [Acinetobacter haemolyticus]WPO68745.1 hypothetical protein SDC64_07445 [Acinetobacter haemolyticus]